MPPPPRYVIEGLPAVGTGARQRLGSSRPRLSPHRSGSSHQLWFEHQLRCGGCNRVSRSTADGSKALRGVSEGGWDTPKFVGAALPSLYWQLHSSSSAGLAALTAIPQSFLHRHASKQGRRGLLLCTSLKWPQVTVQALALPLLSLPTRPHIGVVIAPRASDRCHPAAGRLEAAAGRMWASRSAVAVLLMAVACALLSRMPGSGPRAHASSGGRPAAATAAGGGVRAVPKVRLGWGFCVVPA